MLNEKKRATEVDSLKCEQCNYSTLDGALARMKNDSQNKAILLHLIEHEEGITAYEAFVEYRIMRLASRIHDLRFDYGVPISSTIEQGKEAKYARYRLERGEEDVI